MGRGWLGRECRWNCWTSAIVYILNYASMYGDLNPGYQQHIQMSRIAAAFSVRTMAHTWQLEAAAGPKNTRMSTLQHSTSKGGGKSHIIRTA